MAVVVRNIKLSLEEPEEVVLTRAASRLRVPPEAIRAHAVVRRSLDARDHAELHFVYTVELALADGTAAEERCVRRARGRNVEMITLRAQASLEPGHEPLPHRPVVIGFGPAGMFAALLLAEYGYEPLVLERGRDVRRRHKDILQTFYREGIFNPESNLLYGEGGAGTYSDGKVYTRVNDPAVRRVLAILCRFGADPAVLVDAKPHIGSDRLPTICRRIRTHIERLGGEVRFEARVDDFDVSDTGLSGLVVAGERIAVGPVLLGIGHSARDTYARLSARGMALAARPFQLGVRIEHPQEMVDRWQYGAAADHPRLPPADYQLVAKDAAGQGRDLFSFCMCPGGTILPTNESAGLIATNGASNATRSGRFANSGFVITIDPAQVGGDPLGGLAYQRRWEEAAFQASGSYKVPAQRCSDFLAGRASDGVLETSYPLGGTWCRIEAILPANLVEALKRGLPALGRKLTGFAGPEAIITAPESRASTPVRIVRDAQTRESVSTRNLFPIGEGAGYAGGIVSAAIDGMRTAERLIRTYRPVRT